jgi:hypothetical protein
MNAPFRQAVLGTLRSPLLRTVAPFGLVAIAGRAPKAGSFDGRGVSVQPRKQSARGNMIVTACDWTLHGRLWHCHDRGDRVGFIGS